MTRVSGFLLSALRGFCALLMIASVCLIAANSFGRYVLHNSIIWAEEVLGFALVWMVFSGAVLVTERNEHLTMGLFTENSSGWFRDLLGAFSDALFLLIAVFVTYQGIEAVSDINYVSQAARLPLNLVNAVIPLAFAAIAIILAVRILDRMMRLWRAERGPSDGATSGNDGSRASK